MAKQMSRAAQERRDNLIWTRDSSSVSIPATDSASLIDFTSKLETVSGRAATNVTLERIIGNLVFSIPASTSPGRAYTVFTGIGFVEPDAITAGAFPEPFTDQKGFDYPWIDGRTVFADHTVPASYTSPGINGIVQLDLRSKRRARGIQELRMFGYHDNGLAANPVLYYSYSALWRLR